MLQSEDKDLTVTAPRRESVSRPIPAYSACLPDGFCTQLLVQLTTWVAHGRMSFSRMFNIAWRLSLYLIAYVIVTSYCLRYLKSIGAKSHIKCAARNGCFCLYKGTSTLRIFVWWRQPNGVFSHLLHFLAVAFLRISMYFITNTSSSCSWIKSKWRKSHILLSLAAEFARNYIVTIICSSWIHSNRGTHLEGTEVHGTRVYEEVEDFRVCVPGRTRRCVPMFHWLHACECVFIGIHVLFCVCDCEPLHFWSFLTIVSMQIQIRPISLLHRTLVCDASELSWFLYYDTCMYWFELVKQCCQFFRVSEWFSLNFPVL